MTFIPEVDEMRKRVAIAGVALLAVVLTVAATRDERLADGDVLVWTIPVKDADFPKVHVEAIIDAPPQKVFDVIKDCEGSHRINSQVSASSVVAREGDDVVCSETIDMPWPLRDLLSVTRWSFETGPPTWTRRWKFVRGDFDYANGAWTLKPYGDGQTHAIYENHFKPHMKVPDWLSKAFLKAGMPELMRDLREAVD
jgi:ribosome-associated toxin RatA of RatAB toxin-antitoxin module